MPLPLQQAVDQALEQALQNGFDLADLGDAAVMACDLMDCDAAFSAGDFAAITHCCANWLERRRGSQCSAEENNCEQDEGA